MNRVSTVNCTSKQCVQFSKWRLAGLIDRPPPDFQETRGSKLKIDEIVSDSSQIRQRHARLDNLHAEIWKG